MNRNSWHARAYNFLLDILVDRELDPFTGSEWWPSNICTYIRRNIVIYLIFGFVIACIAAYINGWFVISEYGWYKGPPKSEQGIIYVFTCAIWIIVNLLVAIVIVVYIIVKIVTYIMDLVMLFPAPKFNLWKTLKKKYCKPVNWK